MKVTLHASEIGGEVRIPASKSHTIRALVIGTLAHGTSRIIYPLSSSDTTACVSMCRKFGAAIEQKENEWIINGTGGKLMQPDNVLDAGNSGTSLYLAASMAALTRGYTVFTGDEQIRKRPVQPLLDALNTLGAEAFSTRDNGCAPFVVRGPLKGGKTSIKCPASQYLSSLLITCPLAERDTEIEVLELNEKPYVGITLDWLNRQGIEYTAREMDYFHIRGGQSYKAFSREIPGDFSSATFFLCAAGVKGTELTVKGLDMNDSQGDKAVVEMLGQMGCEINHTENSVTVRGRPLKGTVLDLNSTPDALPALAVTACFAEGTTKLVNVPQARLKETDRIAVMCGELRKMGADIEELPDGLVIHKSPLKGAQVSGHSDHRVVMALAVAALGAKGTTEIETAEAVDVTFPSFFTLIDGIMKK